MKRKTMSCATGCSIGCLTVMLLFGVLILTMCHVPKAKYGPYMAAGDRYYRTVLGIAPKITHDRMLADEAGGFDVTVKFTKAQRKKALTRLYMKSMSGNSEYSFRGTSTIPNIVDLSKHETMLLEKSNEYSEFNQPVSEMLSGLLEGSADRTEINDLTNGGGICFYSTELTFWRRFLAHYPWLKTKSFKERIQWLSRQTNSRTYFYIRRYVSTKEMSTGMLANLIESDDEGLSEPMMKQYLPIEIIRNFPVGSLYEIELENQQSRNLYESNEAHELIKSRYEYPVSY
ncbi:hypothetical protein [Latilactobacillus sakei]|uniref:hypothetical protein n=2 Tax=Latilactobacillus sakei TaxID=1599 RepID=UPI000C13E943|nr:hypothetical protein [Latilactobacillus sakei]RXA82412.1 hypothetical protein EQ835_02405 [Latilactobacillus sakei]UNC21356.1 hypothetical protein FXV74_04840 [Latilactobacillus sakei]UNC23203.1 hypothetical protein FX989_04580 [Latilactobacillus sakei]SOB39246.1 conserved exported hypothetical protein [Latilactobacillus sakei]